MQTKQSGAPAAAELEYQKKTDIAREAGRGKERMNFSSQYAPVVEQ
jgi:hypothetical protein